MGLHFLLCCSCFKPSFTGLPVAASPCSVAAVLLFATQLQNRLSEARSTLQNSIDPNTGKRLFHPEVGRAPRFSRNTSQQPVSDYLYSLSQQQVRAKCQAWQGVLFCSHSPACQLVHYVCSCSAVLHGVLSLTAAWLHAIALTLGQDCVRGRVSGWVGGWADCMPRCALAWLPLPAG